MATPVQEPPSPSEIAEFWVELTQASETDAQANAFLPLFSEWAQARLQANSN